MGINIQKLDKISQNNAQKMYIFNLEEGTNDKILGLFYFILLNFIMFMFHF